MFKTINEFQPYSSIIQYYTYLPFNREKTTLGREDDFFKKK